MFWLKYDEGPVSGKGNTAPAECAVHTPGEAGRNTAMCSHGDTLDPSQKALAFALDERRGKKKLWKSRYGHCLQGLSLFVPMKGFPSNWTNLSLRSYSELPTLLASLLSAPTKDSEWLKPNCTATFGEEKSPLQSLYSVQNGRCLGNVPWVYDKHIDSKWYKEMKPGKLFSITFKEIGMMK